MIFRAARGEVIRETIKTGMPQPSEFLVFNTRRPVFSDIRVRRALTLLFDFEWINTQLLLRALCAEARASSRAPNCPPMSARPTTANASC